MTASSTSRVHTWINSVGVILALVISFASAYLSWRSLELKRESIGFSVQPTNDCHVVYRKMGDSGQLGLCWLVTITNQSENRLSLVHAQVFEMRNGALVYSSGFREFENIAGGTAAFPIALDGGEAKLVLVRTPVLVAPAVSKAIDSLPDSPKPISLGFLMKYLSQHKLDLIGNSLELIEVDGQIQGWSIKPPVMRTISLLKVETGRGGTFVTQIGWPPVGP